MSGYQKNDSFFTVRGISKKKIRETKGYAIGDLPAMLEKFMEYRMSYDNAEIENDDTHEIILHTYPM